MKRQVSQVSCAPGVLRCAAAVVMLAGFLRAELAWKSSSTATTLLADVLGGELAVHLVRFGFVIGILRLGTMLINADQNGVVGRAHSRSAAVTLCLTTATAIGAAAISLLRIYTKASAPLGSSLALATVILLWPSNSSLRKNAVVGTWATRLRLLHFPLEPATSLDQPMASGAQPNATFMFLAAGGAVWAGGILLATQRGPLRLDLLFTFSALALAGVCGGSLQVLANALVLRRRWRGMQLLGGSVALLAACLLAWRLSQWPPSF